MSEHVKIGEFTTDREKKITIYTDLNHSDLWKCSNEVIYYIVIVLDYGRYASPQRDIILKFYLDWNSLEGKCSVHSLIALQRAFADGIANALNYYERSGET